MAAQLVANTLTFVWHPEHNQESLRLLSEKTNAGIIIDLSSTSHPEKFIEDNSIAHMGIKLSWSQYNSQTIQDLIDKKRPKNLWIEAFPDSYGMDQINLFQHLSTKRNFPTHLVTGDISLISHYFQQQTESFKLVIKGNEAVGYSGTETTLTLYSFVESLARTYDFRPQLSIWGGICTPDAAAAFLMSGAKHIIFEHLHLLTDEYAELLNPQLSKRLKTFQVEHTRLLPLSSRIHFRAYDKGNSKAVKNLIEQIQSVQGKDEKLRAVTDIIESQLVVLPQSNLERQQLVAVGIETAFAQSFCHRFGSSAVSAIQTFSDKTARYLLAVHKTPYQPRNSRLAKELSCTYPFIQGAMACITDSPQFARTVAKAGGLPTLALGIKSIENLKDEYGDLNKIMGDYPYCINLITLAENPYRDEQLDWIKKTHPPFVVISAGSPLFAKELQNDGLSVIYVTSDTHLMRLAWENGIRLVVCEGYEAGGHIGNHSTLTLAQSALEMRRSVDEFADKPIILAGGMFEEASANRAFVLGAEGIQLGTAYLATREIVDLKALHELYQDMVLQSSFGDTTITGQSVGLQVRSLMSSKTDQIQSLEDEYKLSGLEENHIRERLEKLSIGSLTIAAKGRYPGNRVELSDEQCRNEGQYMCGAVSGGLDRVFSVIELHEKLATIKPAMVLKNKEELVVSKDSPPQSRERIAITGMAISNALGNSPDEVWQASFNLKSGITDVPSERWDHRQYFSEKLNSPGKTYCSVGAFSSLDITRKELGISPHDFRTMTHSTKLTLWLAHQAISNSGILETDIDRGRIGVIIAQNSGETANTIGDLTITVKAAEIVQSVQQTLGLDPGTTDALIAGISKDRITTDDTTLLGRLSCTAGGFVCNKYNFQGVSFAVTAACATGLVALYNAIQLIRNNILDVAIIGGGEEQLHPASFLEFSALGALGGKDPLIEAAKTSRPFDSERDGMILGEGGAMLVLERESSACGRGAKIYSYITGVGASNNDLGMIESVAETQQLAIQASFNDAEYPPSEVDLVECHITATPTGDIEEVKALKAIYPEGCNTVLTSFKSQIGHTLGTSGLNSLIRGVCAMNQKVFPPTINYDTVDPQIDLESWGFKVCRTPESWAYNNQRPRRMQVNAFGFGGANYVVQLEQADWSPDIDDSPETLPGKAEQQGPAITLAGLEFYTAQFNKASYRIGISEQRDQKSVTDSLSKYLAELPASATQKRALNNLGIFTGEAVGPCKLALLFAGQGTHYKQMGKELYETFPTIRTWMDTIAALADFDILEIMFKDEDSDLRKTVWQQPALFVLEYSIYKQLEELGLTPSVLAGHSMGELTALAVANVFKFEDAFRIICKRASCMDKAGKMVDDPGAMIAVDVPENILDTFIQAETELYYTNYNSPHQTVIGGSTDAINKMAQELEAQKFWNHILSVSMAFHSPIMRVIRGELGDYLADIEFKRPQIPVLSNTTCRVYPDDIDEIQKIIISHLESPVHWHSNMRTVRDEFNIDYFLEIGPRDTLCRFLSEITPEAESLYTCYPDQEIQTFRNTVASLYSQGHIKAPSEPAKLVVKETPAKLQRDSNEIQKIIQNEINIYALQGIEKYLKPAIVKTIQEKIDPSFNVADLIEYFGGNSQTGLPLPPVQTTTLPVSRMVHDSAKTDVSENGSTVELLISIIMDATGYERSEIEPEMDIRQDLSIRSSRLPVIMDAVEKTFAITIKFEEFMGIKTIADFASQIDKTMADQGVDRTGRTSGDLTTSDDTSDDEIGFYPRLPIKRFISRKKELPPSSSSLLELPPGSHVLILATDQTDTITEARHYLEDRFSARTTTISMSLDPGEDSLNPCDHTAVQQALDNLENREELSGVIIFSGEEEPAAQPAPEQVSGFISGLFLFIRQLLESDKRKFCLHIRISKQETISDTLLAQGLLGIFLTGRLEYQSVLFRSLLSRDLPDIYEILDTSLATSQEIIELELEGGTLHTEEYFHYKIPNQSTLDGILGEDDVIVLTAGARGVTAKFARSLSKSGATLILLGRSPYMEDFDYDQDESQLLAYINNHWPDIDEKEQRLKLQELQTGKEINGLLNELDKNGSNVVYKTCDITNGKQISITASEILQRFGKIDLLVHGAGILSDSFISLLSADDFVKVIDVKLTGLVHFIDAVGTENLRQIIGFSSIAALSGNIGQANYCCANRAMSAYLKYIQSNCAVATKVFWLPPIEGAGMADDPEVKDLVKLKIGKHAFVDADEIAEIMVRELISSPTKDCWVAPVRQLPPLSSVVIEDVNGIETDGWLDCSIYPMIDRVVDTDFNTGRILGERTLTQKHDLWINDHKPFKWLDHPIISGIMVVETIFEAARLHNPQLQIKIVQNICFERILECPPETGVTVSIESQNRSSQARVPKCRVIVGRQRGQSSLRDSETQGYFSGEVLLTAETMQTDDAIKPVTISHKEVMNQKEILHYYEQRSGLTGRYRLLEKIVELTDTSITGVMKYPAVDDFSATESNHLLYPHYLLEALMQITGFYSGINNPDDERVKIPTGIGQLKIFSSCEEGDIIYISAELMEETSKSSIWNGSAVKDTGELLLSLSNLTMQWFS